MINATLIATIDDAVNERVGALCIESTSSMAPMLALDTPGVLQFNASSFVVGVLSVGKFNQSNICFVFKTIFLDRNVVFDFRIESRNEIHLCDLFTLVIVVINNRSSNIDKLMLLFPPLNNNPIKQGVFE